jgi:hypothetical protein
VPAELVERERSVAAAKAAEDAAVATAAGKPVQSAEIVAKRIEGGVQKYLKEVSLFNQAFVKNDKQTVEQMLKAAGTTVKALPCTWSAKALRKRLTTLPPKSLPRLLLPNRLPDHPLRCHSYPTLRIQESPMSQEKPAYKRILLKLSGEALDG